MHLLDLVKATVFCGLLAYVIFSFPALAQGLIIGVLSLLWLVYAHKTIVHLLRRRIG